MKHVLLTVLGLDPKPATYTLDGAQHAARLAPVALLSLLAINRRPHSVVALCTEQAQASFAMLDADVKAEMPVSQVVIPTGPGSEDIDAFLHAMVDAVKRESGDDGIVLTIDLTHGLRHFNVVMYVGALYLAALGHATIAGLYYAQLIAGAPGAPPDVSRGPEATSSGLGARAHFTEISHLLTLPRWVHALETLRETGSARVLAQLLRDDGGPKRDIVQPAADALDEVSDSDAAGLPIELARAVSRLAQNKRPLRGLLTSQHRLPLADALVKQLMDLVAPYRIGGANGAVAHKAGLALDEQELRRQALLVDSLLKRHNLPAAFGLMMEWTISWAILRNGRGGDWLDYGGCRRLAAQRIGALRAAAEDPQLKLLLSADQVGLAAYWSDLQGTRNALHHHGMRRAWVFGPDLTASTRRATAYWAGTLRSTPTISLDVGSERLANVLVSPIGERPGGLFSAVRRVTAEYGAPDACIVICSDRTRSHIAEALRAAAYNGKRHDIVLEDPFGGLDELDGHVARARGRLAVAERVAVNITGGTSLMGVAAEKLAQEARKFARPTRRFALVDRRAPGEQQSEPYVEGECVWLDAEGADGSDN